MQYSKLFNYITNALLILLISSIVLIGCSLYNNGGDNPTSAKSTIAGTLLYEEVNQQKANTAITVSPTGTLVSNSAQTVTYTINPALPTGASINASTGEITLPASVANTVQTQTYTITATGTGAYAGTTTTEFKLHLAPNAIDGAFSYTDIAHAFGTAATYNPIWPTTGLGARSDANQTITYDITGLPTGVNIAASTGIVSIIATAVAQSQQLYTVTVLGTGNYGGKITASVKIAIEVPENPIATAYNGTKNTDTNGAILGPFIKEPTTGGLFADGEVINVTGLKAGVTYAYALGNATGNKTADATGKIVILRSDIQSTNAALNARMTLTGGLLSAANQNIATYKNDNINDWKDLQAMRLNLNGSYTLSKDITFPSAGSNGLPATGFVPIGSTANAFTGVFNGNDKKIINLFINNAALNTGTGLFGVINGATATTVVVQKLTLENPSVKGGYLVGGIAGGVLKGTISEIAIKATSSAGTNVKIEAAGQATNLPSVFGSSPNISAVGGIVGNLYGGNVVGIFVRIIKSYNDGVTIISKSTGAGGLSGVIKNGRIVGYSTANVQMNTGSTDIDNLGGLVGYAWGQFQVVGYSTGDISSSTTSTNRYNAGGLIGGVSSPRGSSSVVGYYTGEIKTDTGAAYGAAGGLVGSVNNMLFGTSIQIRGFFTGTINGASWRSGGIIGSYNESITSLNIQAYDRGKLIITSTGAQFGRIIGYLKNVAITKVGFYSSKTGESTYVSGGTTINPGGTGYSALATTAAGTDGAYSGNAVVPTAGASPGSFAGLAFGNAEGQWLYTASKWPAINLGTDMPSGHTGTSSQTTIIDP